MTALDWTVLTFMSEVRLASGRQLVARFWDTDQHGVPAARAGRRALKRLATLRVLDPQPGMIGGVRGGSDGFVYGVGVAGARLLATRGFHVSRLSAPGARFRAHTLAVTEVVVALYTADRTGALDLIEIQTEPACWRGYLGPMGARLLLKSDLFVRIGVGAFEDRWMLEVDLATEASGALAAKARRYLAHYRSGVEQSEHGVYPRVLWATPDARRSEQVAAALGRVPEELRSLFAICLLDEVPAMLAAEADS
jgi:hypothetical protein